MKAKKIKNQISGDWAFSALIVLSLISPKNLLAFEYQDYEKRVKTSYQVRVLVEKMPRRDLEEGLRNFLSASRPGRLVGSVGHKKAQDYIEEKLKARSSVNATFTKEEFDYTFNEKKEKGINFIWEKKGASKPEEVIILVANYDTLLKDPKTKKMILKGEMPGADNNASGVNILLSMMEILNKLEIPKTVRLAFLDAEEINSEGSKNFAKKTAETIGQSKIAGVINLTMLAHDARTTDLEKKMNNLKLYTSGTKGDSAFGKMITKAGEKEYGVISFQEAKINNEIGPLGFPETSQSFWDKGLPGITLTQNRESDLNPRYMTSNDFVETLNIATYTNVFKYVTYAVLTWNYDIVK